MVSSMISIQPKPGPSNNNAKFMFYALITGALQRIERLMKVNSIYKLKLENCLYSRATLSSLSLILSPKTHMKWISKMTRNDLDYKNPEGPAAYTIFKKGIQVKDPGSQRKLVLLNLGLDHLNPNLRSRSQNVSSDD